MINTEIKEFLQIAGQNILIDVRAPMEFSKGHIPGAVNIPLLSDDERKIVGTKYKRESKDTAIAAAIEFIADSTDKYLDAVNKLDERKKICVYCWRGGFRSQGMANLLNAFGKDVIRLHGGYKAYRNLVLHTFEKDYRLIIIGGMTGSGKTELLVEIGKHGEQIVDLEGLANHKGSAFGSFGEDAQPTIQQFENDLSYELNKLDSKKRIWLEDESRLIGKVKIPDGFFKLMRSTLVIKLEMNKSKRIERLVADYAGFDKEMLNAAIEKIKNRLGGESATKAVSAIFQNDYKTATDIILSYYDKTYNYGLNKRNSDLIQTVEIIGNDTDKDIETILEFADSEINIQILYHKISGI
jgi:tRNA 2-selenouridine synthase